MNNVNFTMRSISDNCRLGSLNPYKINHSVYKEVTVEEAAELTQEDAILNKVFSEGLVTDLVNTQLVQEDTDTPFESFSINGVSLTGEEIVLILEAGAYRARGQNIIAFPEREWNLAFKVTVLTREENKRLFYRSSTDFEVGTCLKPLYEYKGFETILKELEENFLKECGEDRRLMYHSASYDYLYKEDVVVTVSYECLEDVILPNRKYLVYRNGGKIATFYDEASTMRYLTNSNVVKGISI